MEYYLSIILYFISFIFCFLFNNKQNKNPLKIIFIIWLYVFLCFGYMTGSDWRAYELDYYSIDSFDIENLLEPGFAFVSLILKKIGFDFFLFLATMKILYLWSLISLLKKITSNWLAALALLMPLSLLFLLIDNPLRFMMALTFINIGLIYTYISKIKLAYVFFFLAIFFHQTAVFFLTLPLFLKIAPRIYNIKTIILIPMYVCVLYISSNSGLIDKIMSSTLGLILTYIEMKDYGSYYEVQNNEAFFTIGSFIQILIFCMVIFTKKGIGRDKQKMVLWGMAIISLFISKILILIPTGFRLGIPFGYFYSLYIVNLNRRYSLLKYIIIIYSAMVMLKNVTIHYVFVPYSNSIPYILSGNHLPYSKRINYNIEAYYKRTGDYPQQQ